MGSLGRNTALAKVGLPLIFVGPQARMSVETPTIQLPLLISFHLGLCSEPRGALGGYFGPCNYVPSSPTPFIQFPSHPLAHTVCSQEDRHGNRPAWALEVAWIPLGREFWHPELDLELGLWGLSEHISLAIWMTCFFFWRVLLEEI